MLRTSAGRSLAAAAALGAATAAACYTQFEGARPPPRAGSARATADSGPNRAERARGPDAGPAGADSGEPRQSYAEAWALICQAEELSGADRTASRQQRGAAVASWIVEHVTNKRARYWFIGLDKLEAAARRPAFLDEARKAGHPRCPLADLLFPPTPPADADPAPAR